MRVHTARATKVSGILVLLAIVAAGWVLFVGPRTAALADAREQAANARTQNEVLRLQLTALTEQAADLDDTRAMAEALAVKFPATADQPGFFRAVSAAAEDAGIPPDDLTALSPTPPLLGGVDPTTGVLLDGAATDLARQTVSITAEADYDETRLLLTHLEQMPRALLVDSLELTGVDGSYTTTITGTMFVMPPVEDPGPPPGATSDIER